MLLKVLLCHNFYGLSAPSGENSVYLAEKELLLQNGHHVIEFIRYSDEIRKKGLRGLLQGALCTPWNPSAKVRLRRILQVEQPDVMHVHNTFPLLSPAVFHATRGLNTAVVFTLHNYRVFCAAGIPMRHGQPCTECLDKKSVLPAIKYGCYRYSRIATVPMALMIALHRKLRTWEKCVHAFIALTAFQKKRLAAAGLPEGRIHIKPHFYPTPPIVLPWHKREPKVVYIGRLGVEKGVHVLIDAWRQWGMTAPELEIVGDGPERALLEKQAADNKLTAKVRFRGQLNFSEAQKILARSSLLVLPSLCFEGFPMVISEAFAMGVPVAASRLGSIPEIVADGMDGVLFCPGSTPDLYHKIETLWNKPWELADMSVHARNKYNSRFTGEKNYKMLMEIYKKALSFHNR